ncbi:HAAS signaling domain-containing protein [Micromonospora chersina]|uniref:HAAS signaling domain-containing protein n=1 Tax=Micromonospora chersina TaxID=47854 RepID=UPI00371F38DB
MTVTGQEIADYVDRVRAALADLPPAVRDELTEDLPEHLAEVAAETDGTLVDRLGEPEAYAAELRAAAGAEAGAGPGRRGRRLAAAQARAGIQLRALDTQLGPLLGQSSVSEFLRPLRPAWWLLRGWLAALVISVVLQEPSGLLPRLDGSVLAGLFLLAGTVLASVWLGRRAPGLRGWPRRLLRLGTAAFLVFSFAMLVNVDQHASSDQFGSYQEVSVDHRYDRIEDVFVYDQEGRLVRNAQLFDQNGVPIRLGWPSCLDASGNMPAPRNAYPYCPDRAPFGPAPAAPTLNAPQAPAAPTLNAPPAPGASVAPAPGGSATPAPSESAIPAPTVSPSAAPGASTPTPAPTR